MGAGVAAAVLVVALVGSDEGKIWHTPGGKVVKETVRALETDNVIQAAFLNAAKIDEGVVLRRIQFDQRLRLAGDGARNIAAVGEEAVGKIDTVGAGRWQALLVRLPALAPFRQLIGNGLATDVAGRGNG